MSLGHGRSEELFSTNPRENELYGLLTIALKRIDTLEAASKNPEKAETDHYVQVYDEVCDRLNTIKISRIKQLLASVIKWKNINILGLSDSAKDQGITLIKTKDFLNYQKDIDRLSRTVRDLEKDKRALEKKVSFPKVGTPKVFATEDEVKKKDKDPKVPTLITNDVVPEGPM